MPIVGTAGHVDHGKSTLVQALTGRDPDRLDEEKERGLTIDLGFAWATLPTGIEIGFVDVPGHEKFIKNMLAGIEAVNVALLVVAADEGWMPQSEEHLAVIDLLEIPEVVVALSKIDRVDADMLELAQLEIGEQLEGTVAEGAPIIPVDSRAGEGLSDIVQALTTAISRAEVVDRGRPRLWVDRAFTIAGAGTVVTGTLLDGELATGETVAVYPDEITARIRGIQSHEADAGTIGPGNRTALNLAGIDRHLPARGSMVGRPGQWDNTSRLLVSLRRVRRGPELDDRGAYHLHVGSGSWSARLRMLDEQTAVLTLPAAIPAAMGDRFILREVGRRAVVAGGRVLDPAPPNRIRSGLDTLTAAVGGSATERADALLSQRGSDRLDRLESHTNGGTPSIGVLIGPWAVEEALAIELKNVMMERVREFHAQSPLRPGMPVAELAEDLGRDPAIVAALAERADSLQADGGVIALAGFSPEMSNAEEAAWEAARQKLADNLAVPGAASLGLGSEQLHALLRAGLLVRVSPDLVFLPEQIDQLGEVVRSFNEPFTVAEFRDRAGITRKYAVPLLEYFDSAGVTVRDGDLRQARKR